MGAVVRWRRRVACLPDLQTLFRYLDEWQQA
jgi:hypothetical protein